ncbi:hypothetical protein I8H83_05140 [Candidatus Saccharibacteria bacterium]|nr:hypothetical protein [Candidatus Saccharibacteria bacterium]
MKKRIIGTFLVLAALTVSGIFAAPHVNAAEEGAPATTNESITLSPVNTRFTIDSGQQREGELTIVNDGKTDYDFLVYARPYWVAGETYDPVFTKASEQSDAYQWVRLPKTLFHAKAGETVKVPYSIAVPATAAPGGHYGVIFAETQPVKTETQGNSVDRKKRVGMIIYASVNGNVINKGSTVSNATDFWQVQPPLRTSVTSKNEGNVDFINKITFSVKDLFGNTKYAIVKDYPVLPQTTRTVALEWANSPWFGLFRVDVQQKFLDKDLTTTSYVLMMPRFLPVLLLVLLLIGGGYAVLRRKKR